MDIWQLMGITLLVFRAVLSGTGMMVRISESDCIRLAKLSVKRSAEGRGGSCPGGLYYEWKRRN